MTTRNRRLLSPVIAAWMLSAAIAAAQAPWQVTVTPTINPLPIGFCGAVHVTVRDGAGIEVPRNPLGARVSIADFDMTVSAPGNRSVAGQQIDASHWSVCACSGATAGAVGTVTASYPAKSLPAAARVPGIAFTSTATFAIAPAKGANPAACAAPAPSPSNKPVAAPPASSSAAVAAGPKPVVAPKAVVAPATAPTAPNNAQRKATSSQAATAPQNSQPATVPLPPSVPAIPSIPAFPNSVADWAALQQALGGKGWAQLQKDVEESLNEPLDDAEDAPPPGVPDLLGGGRNHAAAVAAFKTMLPVLRHPRCANCHANVTYWDQEPEHGGPATHKGGDINELPESDKDSFGNRNVKFTPCADCHTKAPPAWDHTGPVWTGLDDYQMCQQMKRAAFNGVNLLGHMREDELIKLAFDGRRAMEDVTPEPPPLSHSQFLRATTEWINRMDAMKKWPKALSEGCPRTDAWSGAIEYTYTEVAKLTKHESHGVVHVVGGLAKWSALTARTEDHSAKNCRDVFTASASGGGQMQLLTMDFTSENPVTGFSMPGPHQKPTGAAPQTAFVGLTIFPGQYSVSIDLPMVGTGRNDGGGSACPGYKSYTREFGGKIGESGGGKFDPDNPDELSGTMTKTLFPGASVTMKWQFMRLNEARGN